MTWDGDTYERLMKPVREKEKQSPPPPKKKESERQPPFGTLGKKLANGIVSQRY